MRVALLLLLVFGAPRAWPCQDCDEEHPAAPTPVVLVLKVTPTGFAPRKLRGKAGVAVRLRVTREAARRCVHGFQVKNHTVPIALPTNQAVEVDLTLKAGERAVISCVREEGTALLVAE